ncbi:hypothetical protein LCGC14_1979500 [marine sediment metagenome]|uniref:Uncharacterized protein n=2 Tax=root TaxID=1 RepID=A0A0F9I6A7_9ZZZZ
MIGGAMPRPPKGIYHDGDGVVTYAGYRKPSDPAGLTWETVTESVQRALLREVELVDMEWDGTSIVRRAQSEIDARLRTETIADDDAHFERKRDKAIFLVLFDEINRLREAAGLTPRTIQQAKNAYHKKLNR